MVKIHVDPREVKEALRQFGDRLVTYALPMALTRTAQDARAELQRVMPSVFDRPTPYTMSALFVRPATRANPTAEVGFREWSAKGTPAPKYLLPHVEGGGRGLKRHEVALRNAGILPAGRYAVPGQEAEMDRYGNMRRGQLVKILSHLRAFGQTGYVANRSRTNKSRGKRRAETYFAAPPGNKAGLPPGIYQRDGADPRPVLIFVSAPSYEPKFRFHATIERAVLTHFQRRFDEAIAHTAARFAARGSR